MTLGNRRGSREKVQRAVAAKLRGSEGRDCYRITPQYVTILQQFYNKWTRRPRIFYYRDNGEWG
jgi:hypothetical protein